MQLTGSQILVECLKEQGVDTVFGYPGGAILNVYDELYKHSDEIRHILTSHEQGAVSYTHLPIISTVVYMFVGIAMYFVWPVVQSGIYALGGLVTGSGYVGTLIFGIVKRALIPFGLHHVFYMPFWQTAVGGTMEVAGQLVQGGQNIFFAQLADSAKDVYKRQVRL